MKTIKSKFAPKAMIAIFIVSSILLGTCIMCSLFVMDELAGGKPFIQTLFWVVILLVILTIWIIYTMLSSSQKIIITNRGIEVNTALNKANLLWSELTLIDTTGKRLYQNSYQETIKLETNQGASIYIPHDSIRNIAEICRALEHIKSQFKNGEQPSLDSLAKKKDRPTNKLSHSSKFTRYGRKNLFSFKGIMMIIIFVLAIKFTALFLKFQDSNNLTLKFSIVFLSITLFATIFTSFTWQIYYFELSDDALIVRNPALPFFSRKYPLDQIKCVDTEHHFRRSKALRIITKDYDSKLYSAGSLSLKRWDVMMKDLRKKNIKTRLN